MTRTLLLHDRLAFPKNYNAYLEVLDPHPRGGCIKVFDAEKREDRYVDISTLLTSIHDGKLTLIRAGKPRFSLAVQVEDQALHERNRFIRAALRSVHAIQKQYGLSFLQAYRRAEEEYRQQATPQTPPFPTQSTMYRYRNCDLAGLPALRGNKNKGNRQSRYPKEVISIIRMVALQHYLQPHSRWTLKHLTDDVNRQVRGIILAETSPRITSKYVKNTIMRFVSSDPEHDRMLPADAVSGKSFAKQRLRVEMPFERVEQDALHLPFVIQTPSGISSQVWLVHAIDCCTSYPMGWRLVVGAPTDTDSLACIEMYMAPIKQKHFKELGIDHDMNVCGTPGQLVFDNGAEAKGSRIKNLEKLGVDVKHCRARAGQEKPFIERLNRSLKEALEGLSGCTRVDGKDGTRDPIALGDNLMSVDELERWVVRWYYEKWIHTPLERLQWDVVLTDSLKGDTPVERWRYFEESCSAISLPPSRTEWLTALYDHTERRLSRKTGITIDGLHYKGDDIGPLIGKYGEQRPLRVLFNPDDFRHVYVYEDEDLPLVTLSHEHLRPETQAWSFKEAKERFKKQKASTKCAPQAETFDQDMHEKVVADSLAPKRKKPGKHGRNRETAQREKYAHAVTRASQQPGPLPPPTVSAHRPDWTSDTPPASATTPPVVPLLDDVVLLPVLARNSGDPL